MKITKDDVGRKVWSFKEGWGIISNFDSSEKAFYIVKVIWNNECNNFSLFTIHGRELLTDKYPILFWDEIKFTEPEKPKRMVKKVIERWMNVNNEGHRYSYFYYLSEYIANEHKSHNRIACVKLTGEYEIEEE